METKYLYGAAVQGIQSFIFQTNELQDIAGASNLVAEICSTMFDEFGMDGEQGDSIVRAAGNIKFLFKNREDCEKAVREFPKKVMEAAPGITISQAVVKYEGDNKFNEYLEELEKKLHTQRNRPLPSTTYGLMSMERSRKTGKPAVFYNSEKEFLDETTKLKREVANDKVSYTTICENCFGEYVRNKHFPHNISDITFKNDWIAIIHADGNGLGQILQKIGKLKDNKRSRMKVFSDGLNDATKKSAQKAYTYIKERYGIQEEKIIPIRPIVLGGDDFTVICRADFALDYITKFIKSFEIETQKMMSSIFNVTELETIGKKLTCCAGIAFIKSSFPFYYGYELAEALCTAAKTDAKSINKTVAPSCIMFHKVQDSFIMSYQDIVNRELIPDNGKDTSWQFGPYYIEDISNRWKVDDLFDCLSKLKGKKGNVLKNNIRQWLSAMSYDTEYAGQLLERAKIIAQSSFESLSMATTPEICEKFGVKKSFYPAYDILALNTITEQITKEETT